MDLYEYEPLDLEKRSFRLLRLFKADYGPIQCELFHAWLDGTKAAIEYEALSYTWGNAKTLFEIEVNGRKLEVAENLFLALQHLRYQHQDRILWIDALCIDQSNLKERGHQVQQMSCIYTRAEQVVVWLGQATSDTDLFFQHMQALEKESVGYACTDWKSSDERWQFLWSNVRLQWDESYEHVQRAGLENLLRRPWFRRVWILQEIANARSARIICGAKSVSARIFVVAPTLLGITPDVHCQAVLDIMPGPFRQYSWWAGNRDLRTLLMKFKQSEATDPRDIVYALLGISSDGCCTTLLFPDYKKSLEEVIRDTVTFLLHLYDWKSSMDTMPPWNMPQFLETLMSLESAVMRWATANGQIAISELLLETGKIPDDLRDQDERAQLMHAAGYGHEEIIEPLIRTKVDVNWKDEYGHSPLSLAATYGNLSSAKSLLESGRVDVNSKDQYGQTPLSWAASNGHEAVVKLLLKSSKVDVDLMDRFRQTPLSWAAGKGHQAVTKLLLGTGKINVNTKDNYGQTPLIRAAKNGHFEVVRLLLKTRNVGVDIEDEYGQTALSRATRNGHLEVVKLLLEKEKDEPISSKWYGREPLSRVAKRGNKVVAKLLRKSSKADGDLKD